MTIFAADLVLLLCNLKMWYLNVVFTEIKVSSFSLSLETALLPYWALSEISLCVAFTVQKKMGASAPVLIQKS